MPVPPLLQSMLASVKWWSWIVKNHLQTTPVETTYQRTAVLWKKKVLVAQSYEQTAKTCCKPCSRSWKIIRWNHGHFCQKLMSRAGCAPKHKPARGHLISLNMVTFTLILVPLTDHSNCGHVIVAEEQVLGKHLLLPCPKKLMSLHSKKMPWHPQNVKVSFVMSPKIIIAFLKAAADAQRVLGEVPWFWSITPSDAAKFNPTAMMTVKQ